MLSGAKAGGGLDKLVDGFLDRAHVAKQIGEGMVAVGELLGPDATKMAATISSEGAAELGMFGVAKAGSVLAAVELLDTDGDKTAYRWDGKDLMVSCNGEREQSITCITFYKQTSVLEDASGMLELPENSRDAIVEELRLLCEKVGVAFVAEATGGPVGPLASGSLAARALAARRLDSAAAGLGL